MDDRYELPYSRRHRKTTSDEILKQLETVEYYLPSFAMRVQECRFMIEDAQDEDTKKSYIIMLPGDEVAEHPGIQSSTLYGLCARYAIYHGVPITFTPPGFDYVGVYTEC